jgi:hypothetical protein
MKALFLVFTLSSIVSSVVLASSGQYACKDVHESSYTNISAKDIADALNSMNCDTSKPISVNPVRDIGYGTVCCVQK